MLSTLNGKEKSRIKRFAAIFFLAAVLLAAGFGSYAFAAADILKQKTFRSPEEAVQAFGDALANGGPIAFMELFGTQGEDLIISGDEVADRERRQIVAKMFSEKHRINKVSDRKAVLELGNDLWPLPIPIVARKGTWRFDTAEGRQEILNRRIGKDELAAIQVCLAYVDAQREYAASDFDGDNLKGYAQKFFSEPGKKDGLYWDAKEGGSMSPMGIFAANAEKEGYRPGTVSAPSPYHGYYYRILKAQGKHASGGAFDYVVNGKMIGGFALVAYPSKYGASGVMTFLVNHQGIVYQKDLGPKTESAAQAMKLFDPDGTWKTVK